MRQNDPEQAGLSRCQQRVASLEAELAQTRSQLATLQQENTHLVLQCENLQKAELRYRQIFENAPISILMLSAEGIPLEMNSAAERLIGWTIAQVRETNFNPLAEPSLVENGTTASVQRAIAGETVIEPPMYYNPSDQAIGAGQWRWAQGHYYPIRNQANEVQAVVEIALDLTEMYEVQQKLAEERSQLLSMVAQVANLLLKSPDYTAVLPEVVRLLGEAVGCDRCGIGKTILHPTSGELAVQIEIEWCKSAILASEEFSPHSDHLFLWEHDAPFIAQQLEQGTVVNCLVEDLPEPDRSLLAAQGNTAELFVPILIHHQCWGFICFDNCCEVRLYDEAEVAILKIAADTIAAAIERQTKDDELRQTQQDLLQAEQARSTELANANAALQQREQEVQQGYRLLAVVAEVTKNLLENAQVEEAIAQAFQKIGEAVQISRVLLMQEKLEVSSNRLQHVVIQEWTAFGVPRQMDDPDTQAVYNDEYGVLANELEAGRSIWYVVEELPDPAQTQQVNIAVKSTGAVPIFIEGKYFGCVAFDDCIQYREWTPQEIDVLISAAGAIGAALHRKQLIERRVAERIQAEQERSQALEHLNVELVQAIERLQTRDRLLEITAMAANTLLTLDDFDEAMNTTLNPHSAGFGIKILYF